jgi:hypothetical protein
MSTNQRSRFESSHESFSREEAIVAPSNRSFGFVMAAAFAIFTIVNAWFEGQVWVWTGVIAGLFLLAVLVIPAALSPLNQLWLKLGLLLHKVVNPLVMGLLFFGTVLPTGVVLRLMGKDLLRLKPQAGTKSYWIEREPPGPTPDSMKDQF